MIKYNGRCWAEISLDNIAHNAREIRRITRPEAEVMGVVKADGYGHGAVEVAHTILGNGVSRLAVSMLDEAIQLRNSGIKAPILILSDVEPLRADEILRYDITQTVFTYGFAEILSKKAAEAGKKMKVHIKIDTGMGRVGFETDEAVEAVRHISTLPGLEIEGIFTHFAVSDEEDPYTEQQFVKFCNICDALEREGIHIPIRHAANSAAMIRFPHMHLNMVRAGIILYGLHPSAVTRGYDIDLRPAMMLKARTSLVKSVPAGTSLSYGCTYRTEKPSMIATIPVGYADGYPRLLGNKSYVLMGGKIAPIRGRICMDQCLADVTGIAHVKTGDEAVLFGEQNGNRISIDDIAALAGTVNYEIVCIIGKRVPRQYIENGTTVKILNYLINQ